MENDGNSNNKREIYRTYSCSSNARKAVISMRSQNTAFLHQKLHNQTQEFVYSVDVT